MGALIAVALLVILAALRAILPVSTPEIRGENQKRLPNSIAVTERWTLNGTNQSVVIRGRDTNYPVLIWVGDLWCETPALRHFNSGLEKSFVVVYWCQRYSGQSFTPFAAHPDRLTIDDYESDLDALVAKVRDRLHADKVVVVGHSSGTIIGLRYAHHHPEHVAAYVGIGQIVDNAENLRRGYLFATSEATIRQNEVALTELKRIGAPPYFKNEEGVARKWIIDFGGAFHNGLSYAQLVRISMFAPEANWRDMAAFLWADDYVASILRELPKVRFDGPSMKFDVPIYLLSGKYDHRADADLVEQFTAQLQAPRKSFVRFDLSAHSPPFEEPAAFEAWMVTNVREGK